MNPSGMKVTAMNSRTFPTGFPVFVILKTKIFLALYLTIFDLSVVSFELFGLGISREKLFNIAIVY